MWTGLTPFGSRKGGPGHRPGPLCCCPTAPAMSRLTALDQRCDLLGCVPVHAVDDVGVLIQGDRDRTMPEPRREESVEGHRPLVFTTNRDEELSSDSCRCLRQSISFHESELERSCHRHSSKASRFPSDVPADVGWRPRCQSPRVSQGGDGFGLGLAGRHRCRRHADR